jgi:type IV secretion system protein VirB9
VKLVGLSCLVALAVTGSALAQVKPEPGPGDPRLQSVLYDADQVVQIQVAPGYQTTVQFAPDERIENVAVGDSSAWQITPNKRGDALFVKPVVNGVTTNMTVLTSARTYAFELRTSYDGGANQAFTIRFRYPPPATVAAEPTVPAGRYKLSGDRALRPKALSDDGVRTYMVWAESQPLPAVFAVDSEGVEVLVDGSMRDGQFVIDRVVPQLRFRRDRRVATAVRLTVRKGR